MFSSVLEAISFYSSKTPEKPCIFDANGGATYGEYYNKIKKYAAFLQENGIKKGDNVVIKSAQSISYLASFHAVQLLGAVSVPLEKNVKKERLSSICDTVNAKLCIGGDTDNAKCTAYSELDEWDGEATEFTLPDFSDIAEILFTTGTTGKSKGVVLTHENDVALGENIMYGTEMKKDNREVIPMPLNHSFALRRYYANMLNGSTVMLLDGVIFVKKFFDCFDSWKATSAALVPSAISVILKLTGDKLSEYSDRIDYIQFGTAHLGEKEKNDVLRLLPKSRMYNVYGSSEAGCSCILNFNSRDNMPYCIGRPAVNSGVFFVDENGIKTDTDENSPARLVTTGKIVMHSYYNDPVLTEKTIINGGVYSDDLGYIDGEGRVFMLGRNDDVIISGGNKISPMEVEEICNDYKGLEDCAVVGQDDPLVGQVVVMFAVTNEYYDEGELMSLLTERLESFQVPKRIRVIDKIPRSFNGKILRKELKKL